MESNNEKMDVILKKLKKLQASYEGAKAINSENEAATAAAMINKLLLQYNLTMDQVEQHDFKSRNPLTEMYESGYTKKSIGGSWEYRLYYVLCKHNLCRCYLYGKSYKNLYLIGGSENLELVRWMKSMLADRYVELSKQEYKAYVQICNEVTFTKPKDIASFQRSYLMGCVAGLDDKLTTEKKAMEKEVDTTSMTALVLRNDAAITEYMQNKFGGVKSVKMNNTLTAKSAYNIGYAEGKKTVINRPVGSGSSVNKSKALTA